MYLICLSFSVQQQFGELIFGSISFQAQFGSRSLSPLAGTSLYEDQSSPLLSAGGLRVGPLSITVVPVPDPKIVRLFGTCT